MLQGDLLIFQMLSCEKLLEILLEAIIAGFSESAIATLCKRIARFDLKEIYKVPYYYPH